MIRVAPVPRWQYAIPGGGCYSATSNLLVVAPVVLWNDVPPVVVVAVEFFILWEAAPLAPCGKAHSCSSLGEKGSESGSDLILNGWSGPPPFASNRSG